MIKSAKKNLKIYRCVVLIIFFLLISTFLLIFDLTAKRVNASSAIEKEIPCAIVAAKDNFYGYGQTDRCEADCDSTSIDISTIESAGISARTARNYNLHVWVSDTGMGDVPSGFETGNRYYICYEFIDLDTGKKVNEVDSINYTATETVRNSKGVVFEYSYQNSDCNWISVVCDSEDTYRGEVTISGDVSVSCDISFNVRTRTTPVLRTWAWENSDSENILTIGIWKTVHCSYRISDKITDKNLNDASIGWILDGGYTVTTEIYNPSGGLLKKQSYDNKDCAWISFVPNKIGKYEVKVSVTGVFSGSLEYVMDVVEIEHSYSAWTISEQPTCTKTGIKTRKCSICNQAETQTIAKTAHAYDDGVIKKNSTCEEKGIKTYTCTVCKSKKDESIPETGHRSVKDQRVEPTSTQDGLTEGAHCTICGKILIAQNVIPATGQNPNEGEDIKPGDDGQSFDEGNPGTVGDTGIIGTPGTGGNSSGSSGVGSSQATDSPIQTTNRARIQKITASSKTVVYKSKPFSLKAKASGGGKLTYKSSNRKVAVVSTKGKVTVKGYGEAKITIKAAAKGNYKESTKKITVKVVPQTPIIVNAKKSKIKLDKTVSGYEVYFSTRKNFKKNVQKGIFGKNAHGMRMVGLKRNVNYYVKARAYRKVGEKTYYSAWSKVIRLKR